MVRALSLHAMCCAFCTQSPTGMTERRASRLNCECHAGARASSSSALSSSLPPSSSSSNSALNRRFLGGPCGASVRLIAPACANTRLERETQTRGLSGLVADPKFQAFAIHHNLGQGPQKTTSLARCGFLTPVGLGYPLIHTHMHNSTRLDSRAHQQLSKRAQQTLALARLPPLSHSSFLSMHLNG